MARLIGSKVWDRVTQRPATIIGITSQVIEGRKTFFYTIAGTPSCECFPDGGRHGGELSNGKSPPSIDAFPCSICPHKAA